MIQSITDAERTYFIDTLMSAAARTITNYSPEWEVAASGAEGEPLELSPLEGHVAHIEEHTLVIRTEDQAADAVRISRDEFGMAMDDWATAICALNPFFTLVAGVDAAAIVRNDWGMAEGISESTALCIAEHAHATATTSGEEQDSDVA